ncbi:MAG: SH3 domain-containing protein [candidate division Zixibacteria bacterium]|nr:SH3 domain-containing protein [candidate division Zixibacteria bacterium]
MIKPLGTLLAVALAVSLATIPVQANTIKQFEVPARQTAIRILETLKPIESLIEETQIPVEPQQVTREVVEIIGSRVNLRAAPNLESPVVRVALEGERFKHVSTDGEWRAIRDNGQTLYVSTEYSRLDEETVASTDSIKTVRQLREGTDNRARDILSSVGRDYRRLELLRKEAGRQYDSEYGNIPEDSAHPERDRARESLNKIQKYHRLVSQYYQRYSDMAGGVELPATTEPRWRPRFSGSIEAGFGTNTAESKVAGTTISDTDVSRSNLAANVNAELSPNDRINLQFGRTEEIHFVPSARTRARGAYTRRFDDKARLTAHAGLSNYRNDADDTGDLDRSEFGVQGVVTPSPTFRATGGVAITSTAYPNDDARDVNDTRLELGAGGDLSESVQWNAAYRHANHSFDIDSLTDNSQGHLEGSLIFETGDQSAIIVDGHLESNSFDANNDPREYSRHGLRLATRSRPLGGAQNEFSLEWRGKSFAVDDLRDFTEFRGGFRSREYNAETDRETALRLNYRRYGNDTVVAFLDYIEARLDTRRDRGRETTTGLFSEGDLYIQYFMENNGVERNALITQYAWLGISTGGRTVFRIGPHIASNTEIVVVDGATGPDGDDLGTFESPNSTIRYGAKAELRTRERPLRARVSARYELLKQYNIDNAPTLDRLHIEGQGMYSITPRVDASAQIKLYTSGSDDPNATETTETDLLVGLIYHLGSRGR